MTAEDDTQDVGSIPCVVDTDGRRWSCGQVSSGGGLHHGVTRVVCELQNDFAGGRIHHSALSGLR